MTDRRSPAGASLDPGRQVESIRADVLGGAAAVSRAAADLLAHAAGELHADSTERLVAALTEISLRLLDAQPAMAPLVSLAREVLDALEPDAPVEENRRRASTAAREFAVALDRRKSAAAEHAASLLRSEGSVLTLSASSSVEAALTRAASSRSLSVVCLEGRPMNEGRKLAAALAARGVQVTLAVDAALESVIGGCGTVLLGADSVGDAGIVNKIGSAAASHAASRRGIPVFVVADSSKLLPAGFPQSLADDRPPEEVWPDHGGVHVWNRYFELFPISLVARVVTEEGALGPEALEPRRKALAVPPALSAWAASRA